MMIKISITLLVFLAVTTFNKAITNAQSSPGVHYNVSVKQNATEIYPTLVNVTVGFSLAMQTNAGRLHMAISYCLPTKPGATLPNEYENVLDVTANDNGTKSIFVQPDMAMQLLKRCNTHIIINGFDQMYMYLKGGMSGMNQGRIGLRSGNQSVFDDNVSTTASYPITTPSVGNSLGPNISIVYAIIVVVVVTVIF